MTTGAEKVRARKALNHAVAAGRIVPQPCEKCGAEPAQGHHEDYSKPLEVEWLCAGCHSKLHNQKHPVTKACTVCGAEFTPHATKRARAKTCSPECRAKAISKTLADKPDPARPPWTKLTADDARAIRKRFAAGGISMRALGRDFDVSHDAISDIVNGRTWSDA